MLKSNYSVSTSIFKSFNATFIHVIVNFPHLLECQAKIETPFFTTSSLDSRCTPLYILLVVWYNSWACSRFVPHPYLVLLSVLYYIYIKLFTLCFIKCTEIIKIEKRGPFLFRYSTKTFVLMGITY